MGKITNIETIHDYNEELGVTTLHPLVSVVDTSELPVIRHGLKRFGFYCVYLKHLDCGTLQYGRNRYDYQDGTLVFIAPGQVAGVDDNKVSHYYKGWILMFHPDLLLCTQLAKRMGEYSFFSYSSNEALHMSEREEHTVVGCFKDILEELENPLDNHTKQIVVSYIEVFLNHCVRFYDRQFATRKSVNHDVLTRFEELLNGYFAAGNPVRTGLPTVAWCADQVHLSPNYFGDLIKRETGCSAQEYIQRNIIGRAKAKMADSHLTVSEIAYTLGFQYPHHLSRMFKKLTGQTPGDFRKDNL